MEEIIILKIEQELTNVDFMFLKGLLHFFITVVKYKKVGQASLLFEQVCNELKKA